MLEFRIFKTSWGWCAAVAGPGGLVGTFLPDRTKASIQRQIKTRYPGSTSNPRLIPALVRAMQDYFDGKPVRFDVRLALDEVTPFRRRVLEACRKIPRGQTASYGDLARAAGSPNAGRAAGGAMANNPLPLVVPCHRVLRSDGALGGFSSPDGVRLKQRMLELEGAALVA